MTTCFDVHQPLILNNRNIRCQSGFPCTTTTHFKNPTDSITTFIFVDHESYTGTCVRDHKYSKIVYPDAQCMAYLYKIYINLPTFTPQTIQMRVNRTCIKHLSWYPPMKLTSAIQCHTTHSWGVQGQANPSRSIPFWPFKRYWLVSRRLTSGKPKCGFKCILHLVDKASDNRCHMFPLFKNVVDGKSMICIQHINMEVIKYNVLAALVNLSQIDYIYELPMVKVQHP